MRHYEIVFLVHPDQGKQVPAMLEKYQEMVTTSGGSVHRVEDWGRRQLAYPIQKIHKAHYVLMNIEIDGETLQAIETLFRYNDAIIRHLIQKCKTAQTQPSVMMQEPDKQKTRKTAPVSSAPAPSAPAPSAPKAEESPSKEEDHV